MEIGGGGLGARLRRAAVLWTYRSHVWLGLFTAVAVIVISLTGVYLNHAESLGFRETPDHEAQGSIEQALPIRQLFILALTAAHDAGFDVSSPRDINRMMYRPGRGQAAVRLNGPRAVEVVLDANSGQVLQVAPRDDVRLEHIHSGEVLGQRGVILSDVAAGVLILLCLGGAGLWLHRLARAWGSSDPSQPPRSRWLRLNRNVHLTGGLLVVAAVITISVTGIMLNHKRELGYMVEPYRPHDYQPNRFRPMPLAEIAGTAVLAAPDRGFESPRDVRWIDFRPGSSYAKVRFKDSRDTEILVDVYDGDVVSVASRRDVLLEEIHSGAFFGARWTILSDIAAVVLIVLTLNGLYLWVWPAWAGRSGAAAQEEPA